jgi:hypothetical protein
VPECGGNEKCDFNEVETLCPDGFICEGECCVEQCEDDNDN